MFWLTAMLLADDRIVGLPVETEAGERLGNVAGFVMDTETGIIVQYRVRRTGFLARVFTTSPELLIHHTQVIRIETQRVVVRSSGTAHTGRQRRSFPAPRPHPAPTPPLSASDTQPRT